MTCLYGFAGGGTRTNIVNDLDKVFYSTDRASPIRGVGGRDIGSPGVLSRIQWISGRLRRATLKRSRNGKELSITNPKGPLLKLAKLHLLPNPVEAVTSRVRLSALRTAPRNERSHGSLV